MSMFSWIFPRKQAIHPPADSSGLSRVEPTRPLRRDGSEPPPEAPPLPANRKNERMARRERLYTIVRECMVRAGVLSSSYRFKVLSLDGRGRQFLVMVDLSHDTLLQARQFSEIETMIAQSAKARHEIVVTSVYWRTNEYVAVGDPRPAASQGPHTAGGESPAVAAPQAPAEPATAAAPAGATVPQPADAGVPEPLAGFEPIRPEEVAAFRQALASGVARPAPAVAAPVRNEQAGAPAAAREPTQRAQNYTLLTGFEDTEVADAPQAPLLSATQYGDLR